MHNIMKSGTSVHAVLNVTFSCMIKAKRKTHALEMADFHMNEHNILLDRIQLMNSQGIKKWIKVDHIESIHWTSVDSCDYTNLFKVVGQIRLALCIDLRTEHWEDEHIWTTAYQLPTSSLQGKPAWVIPTARDPIFTLVLSQSLERKESKAITRAG